MRVLLSGASGFIGLPLSSFLASQGHTVVPLIRGEKVPYSIQQEDLEGFDAVIHLAGEPLTLSRWSKEKKGRILSSRTEGTLFVAEHASQYIPTGSCPFGIYLTQLLDIGKDSGHAI